MISATRNRFGLALALIALWCVWTTNLPEVALWGVFLVGLVTWVRKGIEHGT